MTSSNDKKTSQPETKAAKEVRHVMEVEQEQGYRGVEVDQTPNSAYTVAGVTSGEPTPETDPELSKKRRAELDENSGRF